MKKINLLYSMIIFLVSGVFAETITLEQARSLALANSRSIQKLNLAIQSVDLDEQARRYSNLPSPSLGASASMSLWNAQGMGPLENPFDTFSAGASFGVSQKIFDGGKTFVQKAINAIASESARNDAQAEFFNVLDSADSAYYAILEAAASLEAAESVLETSIASLAIAEVRQAGGMINQGDYLKALSDKESQENTRNQARRTLAISITKLKALIGTAVNPDPEKIDFSGYEDLIQCLGNISDEASDSLYNRFLEMLAKSNPSLTKALLAAKRAEENLSMAKRGYAPSLSASFRTGLNYVPNTSSNSTSRAGLGYSGGSLSLSATIPVDFWVIANSVEKSRIARDSAALDYTDAGVSMETTLQSTLLNAFSNAGSIISSQRALDYAQKNFEFVQERYRLSQSSIKDLGDASSLLFTSRNTFIKAQYGFLQSLSALRSLGAIDDEQKLLSILMGN